MIDQERRKKLALHLRHLSVGLISNDQFENNVAEDVSHGWLPEQYYRSKKVKSDDLVIQPILERSWGLYDDTRSHKIKLQEESLKEIARYILFLHSDIEYQWPQRTGPVVSWTDLLLALMTFGVSTRNKQKKQLDAFKKHGDYSVWPFFTQADYQNQLKKQPFLAKVI